MNEGNDLMSARYWGEAEWERALLENERLMDRYEEVWEQYPDRKWRDPFAPYMLAHEGIDLGDAPLAASGEVGEGTSVGEPATLVSMRDEMREIPAFRLAFDLASDVSKWLREGRDGLLETEPLWCELYRHAVRIPADIAGGHGLGYDEETLCGNIAKNRWALQHAEEVGRFLALLDQRTDMHLPVALTRGRVDRLIALLRERIQFLRSKVWWSSEL